MSNTEIQELKPRTLKVQANMNNSITISKRTIVIIISVLLMAVVGISYEIKGFCSQMTQRDEDYHKLMTEFSNTNVKLTSHIKHLENKMKQKDEDIEHLKGKIESLKQSAYMDYVRNVGTVAYALGGLGALYSLGLPATGFKIGGEAVFVIGKSTLSMIGMA